MSGTKYVSRAIPKISLHNFDARIDEVAAQVCDAAENVGFFAVVDHGIELAEVDAMFALSETFFALPARVKATVPWSPRNVGWEDTTQVRPSTGAPDVKESYQLQFGDAMVDGDKTLWIADEHVPDFRDRCLAFMHRLHAVAERLMTCFARGLGFPDDFFARLHDVRNPASQSVLRLLHYYATAETTSVGRPVPPRAGAHCDWGFLTMLFQRSGQPGLEICPGREAGTNSGYDDAAWTRVDSDPGAVVCNIGDLLARWSDDRFRSTLHRVKAPCEPGDYFGERYSIAFFAQPARDAVVQGPRKKYPPVTGEQFIRGKMEVHYGEKNKPQAVQTAAEALPVQAAA